jgi:hypothetical protein
MLINIFIIMKIILLSFLLMWYFFNANVIFLRLKFKRLHNSKRNKMIYNNDKNINAEIISC